MEALEELAADSKIPFVPSEVERRVSTALDTNGQWDCEETPYAPSLTLRLSATTLSSHSRNHLTLGTDLRSGAIASQ